MATGFLVSGRCVHDLPTALSTYWGAQPVAFSPDRATYSAVLTFDGTNYVIASYNMDGGTPTLLDWTYAPTIEFPSCDPAQSLTDGMIVGWGIAAAMIAAWAISVMKKGL